MFLFNQLVIGQTNPILPAPKVVARNDTSKVRIDSTKPKSDTLPTNKKDTTKADTLDYAHQKDLIDVMLLIVHRDPKKRLDTAVKKAGRIYFSGAPTVEYSEVTGFGIVVGAQAAFYTNTAVATNLSTFQTSIGVTTNRQLVLPLQSSIWTKGNAYNFIGDWRFLQFPEDTYGLGGETTLSDGYKVDYNYVRLYQFALKRLGKDFFVGPGVALDYHYHIEQLGVGNMVTDYDKYGFKPQSVSSGVAIDVLYDTRENSINPEGGSFYGNLQIRQNLTELGSDNNWTSLILDARKYFNLPGSSKNVLAFWSYNWVVLSGKAPYLDLPSTAWDSYNNTGRGYIQSRFRSDKMFDLEAEYRFGILNNGLIGGVVFTNAETFSQLGTWNFDKVWPAIGTGIRLKFNKFSRTNVAFDYAFGLRGNSGVFVNLGEVF